MLKEKLAAGIMSGTSLDGIDIAIAKIEGVFEKTKITQIIGKTYDYPKDILELVKKAVNNKLDVKGVSDLNFRLAYLYADCVKKLCMEVDLKTNQLDFVASHGQTVYHQGKFEDNTPPSTLQLGNGSVMAQLLETTVVSDFRPADMAQGGQGAPLVPFVDYIIYADEDKSRILQNIGGISNITVIPKGFKEDLVYAFDTGPGNMMINYAMEKLYMKSFDDKGKIASQGNLISDLYKEIINHEYLRLNPPKSCGREQFGSSYVEYLLTKFMNHKQEDIIHTLTKASAKTMIDAINNFVLNKYEIDELIIAGGGVHNDFLINELKINLKNIKVYTSTELSLNSDFKEALAFIILGNQTIERLHSTLNKTTGAKKKVISGSISFYE